MESKHDLDRLLEEHNASSEMINRDVLRSNSWRSKLEPFLPALVILLAVSNILLIHRTFFASSRPGAVVVGQRSDYFNSPHFVQTPFTHDWVDVGDQERPGYRYRDEVWDTFFPPGGGAVALTSEFIRDHGLPEDAAPAEDDSDKRIYMIAGYHQLHCLSVVRDAVYYLNGTLKEWPAAGGFGWDHVLHCIEAVRLGLTCFMDPTLINLNETWPGIPNGQKHQCRNVDAMHEFASRHAHDLPKDPREKHG